MDHFNIRELAEKVRSKRAGQGIRAAAAEVGISSATLSRVENGGIPDVETFGRICNWLGDDPGQYLGLSASATRPSKVLVHFKKEAAIRPESATALSEMILLANKMLLEEEEFQG